MELSSWGIQRFWANSHYGIACWLIIRYALNIVKSLVLSLSEFVAFWVLCSSKNSYADRWYFAIQEHECLVEGPLNNLKQSMVQFQKPKKVKSCVILDVDFLASSIVILVSDNYWKLFWPFLLRADPSILWHLREI